MKFLFRVASTFFFWVVTFLAVGQAPQIQRVEPLNWFTGLKNPHVQLLVYGKNIASSSLSLAYPGVNVKKISKVENPNYLFIDLEIGKTAKPGTVKMTFGNGATKTVWNYELVAKKHKPATISQADFVYLLIPDRFANGNEANDNFAGMIDAKADKSSPFLRHGGDFEGIIQNLPYLQELGVTTLWNTPVIENDEVLKKEGHGNLQAGYHGYHFTDHYQIDRRLGGNDGYKKLSQTLHQRGMKLVQDAVYNHVSDDHWMYKDQPTKDWFNTWPTYTETTHKEQPILDIYGTQTDRKAVTDGWFTKFLPDLNQRNPFLANYLAQHALWSTENFELDGWRIDTYKYNDMAFMNRCNKALLDEYPNLLIFGETWVTTPSFLAYFVQNNLKFPFQCNLPGTCDFPSYSAIYAALNEPTSWDGGINKLYQTMAQDFLYADPTKLVTFLDNHDTDRYLSVIGDDYNKYKMGLTWLLTTRGVPQIYYGTEVLMKNFKNPTDAEVRRDFVGGWKTDVANKFTAAGRTAQENDAFEFVKKLANYRKNTPALHSGKLTQFVPKDGVYAYFRHNTDKTIMVLMNTNKTETNVETSRFVECTKDFTKAVNVLSGEVMGNIQTLKIPASTALVLELQR
jgi:neopullulanase